MEGEGRGNAAANQKGGGGGAKPSSAIAVPREELAEDGLERFVDAHDVVLAQVVPASWAGVDFCLEGALETFLEEKERAHFTFSLLRHFQDAFEMIFCHRIL